MVGFFPDFYPDELLYSTCARYADRINYLNKAKVHIRLFGRRATIIPVLMPTSLNYFINQLPEGHRYTANQIITQHTLMPFYGSFISTEGLAELRDRMVEDSRGNALSHFGRHSLIAAPTFLRYCPLCIEEDRKTRGECYWHRSHQTPGVEVCITHRTRLSVSKVPIREISSNSKYASAESMNTTTLIEELDPSSILHLELERLAKNILWLYREPLPTITSELARIRYLNRLNEMGMVMMSGFVRMARVKRAVQSYYSQEFLARLSCEIFTGREDWLSRILNDSREQQLSPIHHILLIQFLGLSVEDFFNVTDNAPSYGIYAKWFGDEPWPCLNRKCPNYHELCIETCTITFALGTSRATKPRGIFSCKICGFTYLRVGPDQVGKNKYNLGRIIRYMPPNELPNVDLVEKAPDTDKVQKYRSRLLEIIASTPNVTRQSLRKRASGAFEYLRHKDNRWFEANVPERRGRRITVQEHRNRLLEIIALTPNITRRGLWEHAKYSYEYLMDNDNEWFEANVPESGRNKVIKDRKGLDNTIVAKLPELARQLKKVGGKPERVTRSKLLNMAGLSNLTYLHELPKSKALAEKLAETTVEVGLRRIEWAVTEYRNAGIIPSRSDFSRKANVWSLRKEPSIEKAIEEALTILRNSHDTTKNGDE